MLAAMQRATAAARAALGRTNAAAAAAGAASAAAMDAQAAALASFGDSFAADMAQEQVLPSKIISAELCAYNRSCPPFPKNNSPSQLSNIDRTQV